MSKWHTCQISKQIRKKYGYLPGKDINDKPWNDVCAYLIGSYIINDATGNDYLPVYDYYASFRSKMTTKPKQSEVLVILDQKLA